MARLSLSLASLGLVLLATSAARGDVLVDEPFDDTNLADRGWFDRSDVPIVDVGCYQGSCLRYHFEPGDITPSGYGAARIQFPPSGVVFLRYYTRYSADWQFRPSFGPHEIQFLTDADDRWIGPAETHLTVYVEHIEGIPSLLAQDTLNIDQSQIGVDLTGSTQDRGVHGCNGIADPHGPGDCYMASARHRNGRSFGRPASPYFVAEAGPRHQGDWHQVVVEFRLNDVSAGSSTPNAHLRYWYDGELVIDIADAELRTNANPTMAFHELVLGPYYHQGSPQAQDWFLDELVVGTTLDDVGLSTSAPADGGVGSDAGPAPTDGGAPPDGGTLATDASTPSDGGATPTGEGCGCRVAGLRRDGGFGLGLGALGLCLAVWRRRASSSATC